MSDSKTLDEARTELFRNLDLSYTTMCILGELNYARQIKDIKTVLQGYDNMHSFNKAAREANAPLQAQVNFLEQELWDTMFPKEKS